MKQQSFLSLIPHQVPVVAIGTDFYMYDQSGTFPTRYPVKADFSICFVCLKGEGRGTINLSPFVQRKSEISVVMEGQIIEHDCVSDDFEGICMLMSSQFLKGLGLSSTFEAYMDLRENPVIPLADESFNSILLYCDMIRGLSRSNNPFKLEVVRHLTCAFFYGLGYHVHRLSDESKNLTNDEVLTKRFMREVEQHYKEERKILFYADRLHLSPGYLSTVVRACSGRTPSEWIEKQVVQEAKALLKSTNMTIQQISDELNFPSQSFFGKFFKRIAGLSPKEYRES